MIKPIEVQRDQYGYWSHPDYLAFCDGREFISSAEFNQWMESHGLQWSVAYRDEEEADPDIDGFDLSSWEPESPAGEGWFVGSIHDTEDGAVCIWLQAIEPCVICGRISSRSNGEHYCQANQSSEEQP